MVNFIMLKRSEGTNELMKYPPAFMLLTQIALRARRTNKFSLHNLKQGEAMIGDYSSIGITQQQYRTAKKNLEKWGFATFRSTSRETIARITNTDIYNVNLENSNEYVNSQTTNKEQPGNDLEATNNNVKKENNDKIELKEFSSEIINFFDLICDYFPKSAQPKNQKQKHTWLTDIEYFQKKSDYSFVEIQNIIEHFRKDKFWSGNFLSFLKLRKCNKDSIRYIDVFAEKLKHIKASSLRSKKL